MVVNVLLDSKDQERGTFATAVCECWNVSDKYTWDNAADPLDYPWTRLALRIIGSIKRQLFLMAIRF